jgi:hypothetical protein
MKTTYRKPGEKMHWREELDASAARDVVLRALIIQYWKDPCVDLQMEAHALRAIEPNQRIANVGSPSGFGDLVEGDVIALWYVDGTDPFVHLFDAATGEYLAEPNGIHQALYEHVEENLIDPEEREPNVSDREAEEIRADAELHRRMNEGEAVMP